MARPWTRRIKRILLWVGVVLVVLVAALGFALAVLHEPRPTGEPGPAAEALARELQAAVNHEAWERTLAVRWGFGGRHTHLWDRARGYSRIRWGDVEVLQRLDRREGVAREAGAIVSGERRDELVEDAWAIFCNDSYWLNPIAKFFDEGTTRSIVDIDGEPALLLEHSSGGVTPGDGYLWLRGENGTPREWRMWVSILPIGGVRSTWARWTTMSTGARVSTRHDLIVGDTSLMTLELTDVEGAASLEELEPGPDPFAALEGGS